MSSLATFDAFSNLLRSAWSETPIVFENDRFSLPPKPGAFLFVEIFGDRYPQESIGAPGQNVFVEGGVAYLHVMVPKDSGTRVARGHADALSRLFREKDTAGVTINDTQIGGGNPGRDFPNYWALTVTLSWQRQDIAQP